MSKCWESPYSFNISELVLSTIQYRFISNLQILLIRIGTRWRETEHARSHRECHNNLREERLCSVSFRLSVSPAAMIRWCIGGPTLEDRPENVENSLDTLSPNKLIIRSEGVRFFFSFTNLIICIYHKHVFKKKKLSAVKMTIRRFQLRYRALVGPQVLLLFLIHITATETWKFLTPIFSFIGTCPAASVFLVLTLFVSQRRYNKVQFGKKRTTGI